MIASSDTSQFINSSLVQRHSNVTTVLCPECTPQVEKIQKVLADLSHSCPGLSLTPESSRSSAQGGVNGAFFLKTIVNLTPQSLDEVDLSLCKTLKVALGAVFKPALQEVHWRPGIRQGMGAIREYIAYVVSKELKKQTGLDFGVPKTTILELKHPRFGYLKPVLGSLQEYENDCIPLGDMSNKEEIPIEEFAKILLDIVLLNTDRHLGNILINSKKELFLIDHGLVLPKSSGVPYVRLDWKDLPQAKSKIPELWREKLSKLCPKDVVLAVEESITKAKKVYGDRWSHYLDFSDEALVTLRFGLHLLKKGVQKHLSFVQIADLVDNFYHAFPDYKNQVFQFEERKAYDPQKNTGHPELLDLFWKELRGKKSDDICWENVDEKIEVLLYQMKRKYPS